MTTTGRYHMNVETPRGFRDFLPEEAAWRSSLSADVQRGFASWGYQPIETPTLEIEQVLEQGGSSTDRFIALFDSDGRELVLRPDVTLPIARMVATRLKNEVGPFRFRYMAKVFRESESLQGQSREMTQLGIECIGDDGILADAEVITIMVEALEACGLAGFRVSLCSVGVLNALLDAAGGDDDWRRQVLLAYHDSNYVTLDELAASPGIDAAVGRSIAELPRIFGGREAIERCREVIGEIGCTNALEPLEQTWELLEATKVTDHILIDFSVLSSFDYYTGMVMEVYADGFGLSLGGGGRYNTMLESFGRTAPAAGFALSLERIMQALRAQGVTPVRSAVDALVGGADAATVLAQAARLRSEGKTVCVSSGDDIVAEAELRGIAQAFIVRDDGSLSCVRGVE